MPIGQQYVIKVHEDTAGDVVFDSVTVTEFTHAAGYASATSVVKEDFTGSPNDKFSVKITYPSTSLPDQAALTVEGLTTLAKNAVNAVYGNGEAGDPS